jgi:hypothetical protein
MYILYNRCRVIILYIIESPGLCRNYITNFGDFISPFPNYFNLGSDVRYLERNGVRGLFQEGSYVGPGGDMDELKNYLLGRLMFDSSRNDTEVIKTFVSTCMTLSRNFQSRATLNPRPPVCT